MIEYENLGKLNAPFFKEYEKRFKKVLESGWYILGQNVESFEQEFAEYLGAHYVVGVANGLDALTIALKACEFEVGSEIIVPSNTYIATILAIVHAGLTPVLVEPDIQTYNIDPNLIKNAITSKTKAILVVHLYGKSCDMDPITALCQAYDLKLIEDCAQSHGATYKNQKTGTFGDYGCFSFYPTKNLGALGDGEASFQKIKALRNYGSHIKYYNEFVGYNSRLDEMQAAFLSIKLKKLDAITLHKKNLADLYFENIDDRFIKPIRQNDYSDVFHIFNIRHEQRDTLKNYLLEKGIKTEIHYPVPPNKQKAMNGILEGTYPISEKIHETTLSLPISYFHTHNDVEYICKALNNF
jgi:dTDP-4-amino-4,6-dideoxygalactose transaminase